jgi:hypothetical protein
MSVIMPKDTMLSIAMLRAFIVIMASAAYAECRRPRNYFKTFLIGIN